MCVWLHKRRGTTDLSLHPGFWSYLLFWDISSVHQDSYAECGKGKDNSDHRNLSSRIMRSYPRSVQ